VNLQESIAVGADFQESMAVWTALFQDVMQVALKLESAPESYEQFWRRHLCRSLFGMVEAWLSVVRGKYLPLRHAAGVFPDDRAKAEYSNTLFAATDPYEWVLDERGKGGRRKRKIGFRPYMKACIRMMYLLHGKAEAEADGLCASAQWGALLRSARLRDGLMHPYRLADINVPDKANGDFAAAMRLVGQMVEFTQEHLREQAEQQKQKAAHSYQQAALHEEETAKIKKRTKIIEQLTQELKQRRPFIHAIVRQKGDEATGLLVKQHPTAETPPVAEQTQVIVLQGPDRTTIILRTPDAPRLEVP
jgi:hypothetical protein